MEIVDLEKTRDRIIAMDDSALRRAIEDAVVQAKTESKGESLGFLLGAIASRPERIPYGSLRRAIFDEGLEQLNTIHSGVVKALADQLDAEIEILQKNGLRPSGAPFGPNVYREWIWKHTLGADKPPGFSFGNALAALKRGDRVARAGWNGKGMWLALVLPIQHARVAKDGKTILTPPSDPPRDRLTYMVRFPIDGGTGVDADGHKFSICSYGEYVMQPWIGMKTADDGFVPWLASQTDLLAEDWEIVTHG